MARANKMDSTVPWILVGISAPVMLGKQIINVIQMVKASRWLAEGDDLEAAPVWELHGWMTEQR
jgi:CDP-diacylglycerol--inositol 3-phosphatidyltransferase